MTFVFARAPVIAQVLAERRDCRSVTLKIILKETRLVQFLWVGTRLAFVAARLPIARHGRIDDCEYFTGIKIWQTFVAHKTKVIAFYSDDSVDVSRRKIAIFQGPWVVRTHLNLHHCIYSTHSFLPIHSSGIHIEPGEVISGRQDESRLAMEYRRESPTVGSSSYSATMMQTSSRPFLPSTQAGWACSLSLHGDYGQSHASPADSSIS